MKVAIINGICRDHDAISDSIIGMAGALEESFNADCRFFAYACDSREMTFVKVDHVGQILTDKFYMEADIIIYHFGIYYDLFNAVLMGNGHACQIVYFHNITPANLLPASEKRLLEKSIQQITNMDAADEIWAASEESKKCLEFYGIDSGKIKIVPLFVKTHFTKADLYKERREIVKVLYVGRFVESKGLFDLVAAVDRARGLTRHKFHLEMVGNQIFSDKKYLGRLLERINELDLEDVIGFVGEISDAELDERLLSSDIFVTCSYHEGFCVPLIEAMAAGCIPLAYGSGNIPAVVGDCGDLVRTGDWEAFGIELADLISCFGTEGVLPETTRFPINGQRVGLTEMNVRIQEHLEKFQYEAFCRRICELLEPLILLCHK